VPLLGDIPGIKHLFSKESDRHQKRELVIFVTPHILRPGETLENLKGKQSTERKNKNKEKSKTAQNTSKKTIRP